jgi:small subunit ribosomal protein S21
VGRTRPGMASCPGRRRPSAAWEGAIHSVTQANVEIRVHGNQVEKALKVFKRKLARDGVLKDIKRLRYYEKPSIRRKRKLKEAKKRRDKLERLLAR